MIVKWKPEWYALDQSIVVGDIDLFYLSKDQCSFYSGILHYDDYEVKAKICNIKHLELGNIKGIVTFGLDYSIYLCNGQEIIVNAEESPGEIINSNYVVKEWNFDVQIEVLEKTGLSAMERLKILSPSKTEALKQERIKKYKTLLDLTQADWEI